MTKSQFQQLHTLRGEQVLSFCLRARHNASLLVPKGIASAPDVFQHIMHDILGDLAFCCVCIDDVLIMSNGSYEDHLAKLTIVLSRLNKANFCTGQS